jgi:Tol biopolymer transport system component
VRPSLDFPFVITAAPGEGLFETGHLWFLVCLPVSRRGGNTSMKETPVSRRFTIPLITLAAVVAASCSGAATNSPSAADSRAIDSAPPVAPRAAYKGRIAFDYRRAIWVMKADGSGRRQLTRPGAGNDFDPSWSPDGKRIVFRTSRGRYKPDPGGIGAEGIFVIDVATRKERQIQPPQGGLFPAWSPDGKTIAFSGTRGNPHEDGILLMNPDGTNVRDLGLPTGGNECATWSPDSSKLAFCHHGGDGNWAVWTVNADGSDPRQLTHPTLTLPRGSGGDSPGPWSPDGKRLSYYSGTARDLFVINADGTHARRILRWRGGDSPNAWLPSGQIVFAHWPSDQARRADWYSIRPDGTRLQALPWLRGAGDPLDWLPAR